MSRVRFWTVEDVESLREGEALVLGPEDRMTDLARDRARALGIRIRGAGERRAPGGAMDREPGLAVSVRRLRLECRPLQGDPPGRSETPRKAHLASILAEMAADGGRLVDLEHGADGTTRAKLERSPAPWRAHPTADPSIADKPGNSEGRPTSKAAV